MKILQLITNLISIALLVFTSQLMDSFTPDEPPNSAPRIHKTLLIDRAFTEEEAEFITMAAIEWSNATNHVVDIDVVQLPNDEELLLLNSIIITHASPDSPDVLIREAVTGDVVLGLYSRRLGIGVIQIVSSRIIESQYKAVVLHELGHALGLDHNEGLEGVDTLMCPYIDFAADHITPTDLKKFCKLYDCSKN